MNGLFKEVNGKIYRVVIGTKEECTKSLSKFANFAFESYNAILNKVEYYFKASLDEEINYYDSRDEKLLFDCPGF